SLRICRSVAHFRSRDRQGAGRSTPLPDGRGSEPLTYRVRCGKGLVNRHGESSATERFGEAFGGPETGEGAAADPSGSARIAVVDPVDVPMFATDFVTDFVGLRAGRKSQRRQQTQGRDRAEQQLAEHGDLRSLSVFFSA